MSLAWPTFWAHVPEADRAALKECLVELLTAGALLGDEGRARELYLLARDQYFRELSEYLAPLEVELIADPERPFLQARPVPGACGLLATFTKDETLLVLTLWRMWDETRVEQPAEAVIVTANDVWAKLKLYFEHLEPPTATHLAEMLAKLRRHRLIRFQRHEDKERFGESFIEVLPTLQRVIPFENSAEWDQQAAAYRGPAVEENGA